MERIIYIRDLSKAYRENKGTTALDNISFYVNKGEMIGFIGPNGAGKTTLFRILSTLMCADKGEIEILGRNANSDFLLIRNYIGFMPENFSNYLDLTVSENIELYSKISKTKINNTKCIQRLILQLETFKNRKAKKLSGGMKQKLALCCALIKNPSILILDEPMTGLDIFSQNDLWKTLKELKELGTTILISTPYTDDAIQCDRIALMQSGKILRIDSPMSFIESYPYKIYRIVPNNKLELIENLRINEDILNCYIKGKYIYIVIHSNTSVLNILRESMNIEICEITPSIEDCFIQLIQ
jgi:ABC-type multidrug transport system ATPase subunit